MSDPRQSEILRELFAAALNSDLDNVAPAADDGDHSESGPYTHPIDDDDLLLDWSLGDLTPARQEQLVDHLAACSACRREVAAMIRAGVLVLPEKSDDPVEPAPSESAAGSTSWRRPATFSLLAALAASLMLLLAPKLFDSNGNKLIKLAQRDLQQGRADAAFARMETFLSDGRELGEDRRARAAAILESSGYELARGSLLQGEFHQVTDIESRAARRGADSSRLVNLRIQAERGETVEQSLARAMSLVEHYGYEPDGRQAIKSFTIPEITATDRRIEAELLAAIETYPDEANLRLNYGQLLLEQNEFERAAAMFAEAARIAPDNALAHTGLALALFQQDGDDAAARALEHFQRAAALNPHDPVVNLNLAVCLMRLKSWNGNTNLR